MGFNRCYACMGPLDAPGGVCPRCGFDNTSGPARQADYALRCGTVLAERYVIGKMLGHGGFGITYLAWNLTLETRVCIKEYFPEGGAVRLPSSDGKVFWGSSERAEKLYASRDKFVREARKAAKLSDLNHVVKVWDVFFENETAYIVMDYIEGKTLRRYLDENGRRLGEQACISLLAPVMQELEKVHARGIIHRDIKPANIMLRPDGEPVLLDLGAAKDLEKPTDGESTSSVVSIGYSPLEQYSQKMSVGPWTDVYALCATICHCVTGEKLPAATDRVAADTLDLSAFSPAAAAALEKGLAIRPRDRTRSMRELAEALGCAAPTPDARESAYQAAKALLEQGDANALAAAQRAFAFLGSYLDAQSLAAECDRLLQAQKPPAEKKPDGEKELPSMPPKPRRRLWIPLLAAALLAGFVLLRPTGGKQAQTPPSPAPTVFENAAPTLAPTPVSSPAPSPDPTPVPTPMPTPEPTPVPTPVPTPEPTPVPTPEPTPEPTPDPLAEAYTAAEALLAAGDKAHAAMAFYALGDYTDARTRSFSLWREIIPLPTVALGDAHSVGVRSDGTVLAAGQLYFGRGDVGGWTDIVSVAARENHTVGLHAGGTVVSTVFTGEDKHYTGQCETGGWTDIVAVAAGKYHTVGLRSDGAVVSTAYTGSSEYDYGMTAVDGWTDIVAVAANDVLTIGLRADGTVVTTAFRDSGKFIDPAMWEVSGWTDIVAVAAGRFFTAGLRADGTVLVSGSIPADGSDSSVSEISAWTGIDAIAAGGSHLLGLRADGTLIASGDNRNSQCSVEDWSGIVSIAAGFYGSMGIHADGTVIGVGSNQSGMLNAEDWTDIRLPAGRG